MLDEKGEWHSLDTCFWNSPSPLEGYVDLQATYPGLEKFFIKRMKTKKVSPAMLIGELKRMAEQKAPQVEDIRLRLIGIASLLIQSNIDFNIERALEELRTVRFLPKRQEDSKIVLIGMGDDFAISDHVRYGKALADRSILLDFDIYETQILHVVFQRLGLTSRYPVRSSSGTIKRRRQGRREPRINAPATKPGLRLVLVIVLDHCNSNRVADNG